MKSFCRAVFTIWQREIIRYIRDRTRIVTSLIQPILFLFVLGTGLSETIASTGNFGTDYIQFMFPGIIAMAVMGVAFFSTISTVWDREFGFLKEILVTPVSRTSIAVGKTVGATTIAFIQAIMLLALAPIVGVTISWSSIIPMTLTVLLIAFAVSALGLLIASLLKTIESFSLLMQILVSPMFFTSGAFFPLNSVPDWMMYIANANPLTYGVDALRHIILGPTVEESILESLTLYSLGKDFLFLIIFSVVMIIAAVFAFRKRS